MIDPRILEHHVAVLGKSGAGKSFATRATIVEPLLDAGRLLAIVDPTSAWWGLRSSADGKGPGYKVLVLGGDHGDLPLPANGGAAVARLIVEQRVPCVLDTGNLTVGERTRWMIDFAGTLYRINRTPLYLVVDECHVFAPQGKVPDPDTGRMLHAVNQIAAGGRSRGIRLTMITQRPQKLHKDALTTADTLIAMRVLAPQDRAAVKDWIDGCGDPAQGKQVLESLAQLQRGEGWVWYPEGGVLTKMKFPRIRTFDSSATPQHGGEVATPKGAAEIDLTEINAALEESMREAFANDPGRLRKRIAELEGELEHERLEGGRDPEALKAEYERGRRDGYAFSADTYRVLVEAFAGVTRQHMADVEEDLAQLITAARERARTAVMGIPISSPEAKTHIRALERNQPVARNFPVKSEGSTLSRAERLILTALAQYPQGRSKSQIAVLTGYAVNGGGFNNAISAARSKGRLEGSGDRLTITPQGLADLGPYDPLPRGSLLLAHWLAQLGKAERAALQALADAYPGALTKEALGRATGYEPNGGGFNNALSRLRTLELIEGRGELRASAELF